MRSSLLSLHKALILAEQVTYERINGRVESTGQLLQLVLNDPWFTWLHPVVPARGQNRRPFGRWRAIAG